MQNVTGVTTPSVDTSRYRLYARGYEIDMLQVDGIVDADGFSDPAQPDHVRSRGGVARAGRSVEWRRQRGRHREPGSQAPDAAVRRRRGRPASAAWMRWSDEPMSAGR
ncbi:MAG: hypothetical protein QM777_04805 [Pseudorhodoferax sp.]